MSLVVFVNLLSGDVCWVLVGFAVCFVSCLIRVGICYSLGFGLWFCCLGDLVVLSVFVVVCHKVVLVFWF